MDSILPKWEPVNIEAEQGLLGAILVNNEAHRFVSDILKPEHFGEDVHAYIYEVCEQLINTGKLASPITLKGFIQDHQVTPGMTTTAYLARLAAEATTIINARDYAITIRDLAKRRELMDVGYRLQQMVPGDALAIASGAIEEIDGLVADLSNSVTRGVSATGMMAAAIEAAATAFEANGRILGLPSGITKLDRKLLGFTKGELVILAGRPGMGKSALMVTAARNMAQAGHIGILFSQEMSEIALGQRMIADHMFNFGAINYFNFRSGRFDEVAFKRATEAAETIGRLPLRIEPAPAQTAAQIAAQARQAKRRGGLDFIFVDHLQIMQPSGRYMSRNDQIGEITAAFKALAKELDIVVILLCQLSRAVETRDNKRPQMSDLRDSGNIEQDADVVIMLYREMYYLERREPDRGSAEHAAWQTACFRAENRLEIIIEKQRAGPTGTIEAFCNIGCNAVRDLDEREVQATAASGIPPHPDDDPRFL